MKIKKDMSLGEVISRYPETVEVFTKHGLHYIGCAIASFESIEQGALAHGIDVNKLVKDLNTVIEKGEK